MKNFLMLDITKINKIRVKFLCDFFKIYTIKIKQIRINAIFLKSHNKDKSS